MSTGADRAPVVIVGGGLSGAAVAWQLSRMASAPERIIIIEPRAEIGRGLAYSAPDPSHRINVPSVRMSIDPRMPDHFNDWLIANDRLAGDPAARMPDGRNFPSRAEFGSYIHSLVEELGDRIEHVVAVADEVTRETGGFAVRCSNGRTIHARIVVLAVCHPPPTAPRALETALGDHPRFVANPWAKGALDALRPDDRVLIVGTGLTMADIVASLDRNGHRGPIVAASRRGLRSRGHATGPACDPYGDFVSNPARNVRDLVRRVRATVEQAGEEGYSWHYVFDQLKAQGTSIWTALPLRERQKLVRHLRPFWDVHRFRIAPQIEKLLDRRLAEGSLELKKVSLKGARQSGDKIEVDFRNRRNGELETQAFDAVVLATGPAHGRVFADNPVLATLERQGLAHADPLLLGIAVDMAGRALDKDGSSNPDLFVAGPLARGTFGELMGLPDVTNHAIRVASGVAARLAETKPALMSAPNVRRAAG